jgi:hypothetical protein
MAWPSWFPTASRPATWEDWGAIYKAVSPREWPRGLYRLDSEGWGDLQAFGESLGLVRDLMEWLLRAYFPVFDTNGVLLSRWESSLGLSRKATIALRLAWITARCRLLGKSMTEADIKSIMCWAWGTTDPAVVSLVHPDTTTIVTYATLGVVTYVQNQNCLHIYRTGESAAPDYGLADTLIAMIKPTWQAWTVGQYNTADCDLAWADRAVCT